MTLQQAWAPAKVNLFLHVTGRRDDGYHLLDSLAVFPAMGDLLSVEPAPTLSLSLCGQFGAQLAAESDNLVLRAARALAVHCDVTMGARLVLDKRLPIASGIGGGSADAAAALRLLCQLWQIDPGIDVLERLAAALGADIPVCLASRTARMQGIGEILSAGPKLPEFGMVLVNPRQSVATPAVFKARSGGFTAQADLPHAWADAAAMVADLRKTRNDLEAPAQAICPAITSVLQAITADTDCLLARMSGSGATCFGIYADASTAERAATRLAPTNWWIWGGGMHQAGLPDHGVRL